MRTIVILALPCLLALAAPDCLAAPAPDAAIQTAGKVLSASSFCQSYAIDRARLAAFVGVAGDALDAWMADHDAEIRSIVTDQSNLRESSPRAYCTTAWRSFGPNGSPPDLLVSTGQPTH